MIETDFVKKARFKALSCWYMCVCLCASAHINAGPCSRHVICISYEVGNPIIIAVTGYKWRLEGKVGLWICSELHMTYLKTSAFKCYYPVS